jgi:hypothetical protein
MRTWIGFLALVVALAVVVALPVTGQQVARLFGTSATGTPVPIAAVGDALKVSTGYRESFDHPFLVRASTATANSGALLLADTNVNVVTGGTLPLLYYWEEQTKTVSSWVVTAGKLDISADDTADNEGVEFYFGDPWIYTAGWVTSRAVAPRGGACFEVNFTLGDNAGTDQFLIGWRKVGAFDAAINYANYTDWAVVGINNVDGSIFSLGEVATGGTLSDDSGVNMADGDTRTLKVCIAAVTGVPSAFYTANGGTAYTAITMTNSGVAKTDAVELVPFISYINAAGTNAAIFINWWQVTR